MNKIEFFCPNCRCYQQLENHVFSPNEIEPARRTDDRNKSYYRCRNCRKPLMNQKGDTCHNLVHMTKVFREGLWSVGGTLYNANSSCDH